MTERILRHAIVAHDGRSESDAALLAGAWCCQLVAGADLHVRHVVDLPAIEDLPGPPDAAAKMHEDALRAISAGLVDHLRKVPQGDLPVGYGNLLRVVAGRAKEVLAGAMQEHEDSILFVGPHQRSGWIDMGSTLRALLQRGVRPVWRQRGAWKPPKRVVLAADHHSTPNEVVRMASALASAASIPLHALHAHELRTSTLMASPMAGYTMASAEFMESERLADEEGFAAWLGKQTLPAGSLSSVELGRASEVLIESADAETLLVMGSGGMNALEDLFVGSTSYEVLAKAAGPVLVV